MSYLPTEALTFSGRTIYMVLHNPDGKVWNKDSAAWEAYVDADWVHYAVPMTEQGASGYYRAAVPMSVLDVNPTSAIYQQNGVQPDLSDVPGIGLGQAQGANIFSLDGSVVASQNLSKSTVSMEQGTVQSGSNTTGQIVSDLTGATNNIYRGRVIVFTSGAMKSAAAIIKSYDAGTKILTFTDIPTAPTPGDTFVVV